MVTNAARASPALDLAKAGDQLTIADLNGAFQFLIDEANALNADAARAPDVATQQAIGRTQNALLARAAKLNAKSIDLLTDEARITAEHINSAVTAAKTVIEKIASIKSKLEKLGAVLDFFAAVLTGSGTAILAGANDLESALTAG
jgi:hypothetical protein